MAGLGQFPYDMVKYDAKKSPEGSISDEVEAELDVFNTWCAGDVMTAGAAFAALAGGVTTQKFSLPVPQHPSPSAKIVLSENHVRLFAGVQKESDLQLDLNDGIVMKAQGPIALSSETDVVTIAAAKGIALASKTQLKIQATINHRHLKVLL
jgi:hypothetical protein